MAAAAPEPITRLAFAQLMGTDESTIRKYIRLGKIHGEALILRPGEGPGGKVKALNLKPAKVQYLEARALTDMKFRESGAAAPGITTKAHAAARLENGGGALVGPELEKARGRGRPPKAAPEPAPEEAPEGTAPSELDSDGYDATAEEETEENETGQTDEAKKARTSDNLTALTLKSARLKAEILQMDLDAKKGLLVPVAGVRAALFTAGQEIRKEFEGLPARIVAHVLAAPNPTAASVVMEEEINAVLEKLANLPGLSLTAR